MANQPSNLINYMALDIGEKRVGVALANSFARIANPLTTIENTEQLAVNIQQLMNEHDVSVLIAGVPRGLDGQDTAQTAFTIGVIQDLEAKLGQTIVQCDEAGTSHLAESALLRHGKPYEKSDIDAWAARYILEDYMQSLGVNT
jgi:putative Holliday junction resolvase